MRPAYAAGAARRIPYDEAVQRTLWDFWTRTPDGVRGPLTRPGGNGPKPAKAGPGSSPKGAT